MQSRHNHSAHPDEAKMDSNADLTFTNLTAGVNTDIASCQNCVVCYVIDIIRNLVHPLTIPFYD